MDWNRGIRVVMTNWLDMKIHINPIPTRRAAPYPRIAAEFLNRVRRGFGVGCTTDAAEADVFCKIFEKLSGASPEFCKKEGVSDKGCWAWFSPEEFGKTAWSSFKLKCHVWRHDEQRNVRPFCKMACFGTRNWVEHWGQWTWIMGKKLWSGIMIILFGSVSPPL